MLEVEIRVKGHIDSQWDEWLEGLTITHRAGAETVLAGRISDQAALYGLITRLRDLGLTLLSIHSTDEAGLSPNEQ